MNEQDYDPGLALSRISDLIRKTAADCAADPELRAELDADPRAFFTTRGYEIPAGPDVRVAANTPEVFHVVMPRNPNASLADEELARVAGGTRAALSTHLTSRSGVQYSTTGYPPPQYPAGHFD